MTNDKHSGQRDAGIPVAVIGLHGRFPGADDAQTFWENLRDGRDAITTIPPERWDYKTVFGEPDGAEERTYATTGGFIRHVDCFDCGFFNILPREAESMDPQQRLFLQTAWQALEDAGQPPKDLAGRRVGVFVGVGHADYPVLMRRDGAPFDVFRATGIVPTAIANRVSFSLDLRGPSESIDTACSGSLVAIHRAVQSLEAGECDLAIAGGVNLLLGPELFIAFAKAGMLSRSGRCRVLDANGDGYVRGEGVAALILRPLEQAEANGDFIYGVIRGSAENHGGKTHSFTAPGVSGQADVITRAWKRAGRSLHDASLMEMHGTGTPLGDPIEFKGLKKAFEDAKHGPDKIDKGGGRVALGALKSHVGHLEAAAGIGGVIKTLLSMQNGLIPPNLHFGQLNPQIDLAGTPFFVPVEPVPLGADSIRSPIAGVSSFGFGGVNAHVVIEGYRRADSAKPTSAQGASAASPYLFVISARDEKALARRVEQLLVFLGAAGPRQDPHGKIDVQRVSDALGLAALSAECGAIRLDSLDLSEGRLILALKNLNATEGVRIGISDVRDCVTVADLATRIDATIGRHIDAPPYPTGGEADLPRVALAPETMRHADLAAISYSLMHGRNAMHERLAVVTGCKTALMAKLHSFLKDPFAAPPGLVRGSVLSLQSATKPELAADEAAVTAQSLENWAHYWVSNRDAKLCWRDCHHESGPPRVPLPAYPFELKRIWYTARDRSRPTACASTETDPVNASADFTAASLTESLASISKAPSVGLSTAPIALGRLLDHLSATRGDRPIHLSRVEFAQPFASNGAGLICRVGRRGQTDVVQCLDAEDSSGHVLVQAHLGAAIADTPHKGRKERPEMRMLPPLELYSAAERVGARVAPDFRCIEAAEATSKELAMKVTLSRLPGNDTAFWHALLSSILTGGAFLRASIFGQSPHASDLHLYRVSMLTFDPSATAIADIAIEHSDNDGSLHVRVRGVDGRCVLELRGLRLREGQTNQGRLAPAATPASRAALAS